MAANSDSNAPAKQQPEVARSTTKKRSADESTAQHLSSAPDSVRMVSELVLKCGGSFLSDTSGILATDKNDTVLYHGPRPGSAKELAALRATVERGLLASGAVLKKPRIEVPPQQQQSGGNSSSKPAAAQPAALQAADEEEEEEDDDVAQGDNGHNGTVAGAKDESLCNTLGCCEKRCRSVVTGALLVKCALHDTPRYVANGKTTFKMLWLNYQAGRITWEEYTNHRNDLLAEDEFYFKTAEAARAAQAAC